jgi:transketolase
MPLTKLAREIRQDILLMNCYAGSGNPAPALSLTEIVAHLFHRELNFHPDNVSASERDRFILSDGQYCLALYAALAQRGFFSRKEYRTFRHVNGNLQGFPDRLKTLGVEFSSGASGEGLSFAVGCALGCKRKGLRTRVYAILGDRELAEGQTWEGMAIGAHYCLDNLVVIINHNTPQSSDPIDTTTPISLLPEKLHSFGWKCLKIDGHSFVEIAKSMDKARATKRKPTVILAHTVYGKGVSFMEFLPRWHGYLAQGSKEREQALEECGLDASECGL